MKKAKALAFIIIFVCMFFVMGYTFGEASIAITFGNIDGFVYENEYLGVGCQFDGWHFYNVDELKKVNALYIGQWLLDLRSVIQKHGSMTLMYVETPNKMINVNISVSYDPDAEFQAELFGMQKTVSMLYNQKILSLRKKWGESVSLTEIKTSIGSETFYGFDASYVDSGKTV